MFQSILILSRRAYSLWNRGSLDGKEGGLEMERRGGKEEGEVSSIELPDRASSRSSFYAPSLRIFYRISGLAEMLQDIRESGLRSRSPVYDASSNLSGLCVSPASRADHVRLSSYVPSPATSRLATTTSTKKGTLTPTSSLICLTTICSRSRRSFTTSILRFVFAFAGPTSRQLC